MFDASIPLIGFRVSGCDAKSHLFYFKDDPELSNFDFVGADCIRDFDLFVDAIRSTD